MKEVLHVYVCQRTFIQNTIYNPITLKNWKLSLILNINHNRSKYFTGYKNVRHTYFKYGYFVSYCSNTNFTSENFLDGYYLLPHFMRKPL